MSAYLHPSRRPSPRPAPKIAPGQKPMPKWGWLEWFMLSQTILPALMFVPGLSVVRTPTRVAAFAIALVAWWSVASNQRRSRLDSRFPATPWLVAVIGWLSLLILHPEGNTFLARIGQVVLYTAILCPAFWAGPALKDPRQVGRVLKIMFVCNALGSVVGLGQVFRPGTFNPPVIPAVVRAEAQDRMGDVTYADSTGRRIMRPCGLTDQIGAGAQAGMIAALLGMGLFLKGGLNPIWRIAAVSAAFAGVAVIYYSQVRMTLAMLAIALALLTVLFVLQRDLPRAGLLGMGGTFLILGSFAWVAATSGTDGFKRFTNLIEEDPSKIYYSNRGMFVQAAFTDLIWQMPLGSGLGNWGMINDTFGKPKPDGYWVEVMIPAWFVDGGVVLFVLYVAGMAVAMFDTLRIALSSRDPDIKYWAALIFSMNMGVIATCFSYVAFLAPMGLPFWLFSASLHRADQLSRADARPKPKPKPKLRRVPGPGPIPPHPGPRPT